ncbi:MAG: squalene-hopene/tetraprenyl-beta-curcumene cyclase, partial [Gammaproteobacteria bacterium]
RQAAIDKGEAWTREHMSGVGGIGGIYPAMANAVTALSLLGYDHSDPDMKRGLQAIEDLVIDEGEETYVQPCVSPVWDTCLSISALSEADLNIDHRSFSAAVNWLFDKQVFVRGDWKSKVADLDCGAWAFQFENDLYPDVDDTCSVVMAMLRIGVQNNPAKLRRIAQAVNWVIGMQNSDGGWGAFDIDNHYEYLNEIPFADHGALVDPSTADLTGRCIEMLAMLGYDRSFPPIARGLDFLRLDQHESGAWFGRWGVNYVYGTWSVLIGLGILGEDAKQPYILKAIDWLKTIQNSDGGWGEDCNSYDDPDLRGKGESTPSQTAWALLGLMAVGEVNCENVERGMHYLLRNQETNGAWKESLYTGTGFPRVFYLRYHGYSHYFPLWALSVYRNARQGLPTRQEQVRNSGPINLGPLAALQN